MITLVHSYCKHLEPRFESHNTLHVNMVIPVNKNPRFPRIQRKDRISLGINSLVS